MATTIKNRIPLYRSVLKDFITNDFSKVLADIESQELEDEKAMEILDNALSSRTKISRDELKTFDAVADLVDDDEKLMSVLWEKRNEEEHFNTFSDLAMDYDRERLSKLFHANQIPDHFPGETQKEKENKLVRKIETKLFSHSATACMCGLLKNNALKLKDPGVSTAMFDFLGQEEDFDIRAESILPRIKNSPFLAELEHDKRIDVVSNLKDVQRLSFISPTATGVKALHRKGLNSAQQIHNMPIEAFVMKMDGELDVEEAKMIYNSAEDKVTYVAATMANVWEMMGGTGVAAIDKPLGVETAAIWLNGEESDEPEIPINYEELFGSADYCECGHCNSVYSPSAYFVDLLEYVKHNNLEQKGNTSALDTLFKRRPDLMCLELTCSNAMTVLPYIDLANEVMENYIVHNNNAAPAGKDLTIQLDTYNTSEEDESLTLLSQPQYIHKKAYCKLADTVFPFTLPYNQPIDASRIFLKELNISRYELMKTFRPYSDGRALLNQPLDGPLDQDAVEMAALEVGRIDRALCAERLLMTELEFISICREGFASKRYLEAFTDASMTIDEYRTHIGVRPLKEHFFRKEETYFVSDLQHVKQHFLPRTGLSYQELVDILKTNFINPRQPRGEALAFLENIKLSYRFLQGYVNETESDPKKRFEKVIDIINRRYEWLYGGAKGQRRIDHCTEMNMPRCLNQCDLEKWVYYHFEEIGKVIVLETGDGVIFKYAGPISDHSYAATLITEEGNIVDDNGTIYGYIRPDLSIVWTLTPPLDDEELYGNKGYIKKVGQGSNARWEFVIYDHVKKYESREPFDHRVSCDISKQKLRHLNGTPLTEREWRRFHQFIRLWRKLGWSIHEVDSAVTGMSSAPVIVEEDPQVEACLDDTSATHPDDCGCSKLGLPRYDVAEIDAAFLCHLATLQNVRETLSLPLEKLLTFWSDIETRGDKPLYAKLFLKRNLRALDDVFVGDANSQFLIDSSHHISEHMAGLMAGLNMKAEDILFLNEKLNLADKLTLGSVSKLYRYQTLARTLSTTVRQIWMAKVLFGQDPFLVVEGQVGPPVIEDEPAPAATEAFLKLWKKVQESDLDLSDLSYIIQGENAEGKHSLSLQKQVNLANDLANELDQIDLVHGEMDAALITKEVLRTKLGILFDEKVVTQVEELLTGKIAWQTNAPATDQFPPLIAADQALQAELKDQFSYHEDDIRSSIKVKGILTKDASDVILAAVDGLPSSLQVLKDELKASMTRIGIQQKRFCFEVLEPAYAGAGVDLVDDLNQQIHLFKPNAQYAPEAKDKIFQEKAKMFLDNFLPKLRQLLKERLITEKLGIMHSIKPPVTEFLLKTVLTLEQTPLTYIPLMQAFLELDPPGSPSTAPSGDFDGYLIPTKTDEYTFMVYGKTLTGKKGDILLDGDKLTTTAQPDPSNLYLSEAVTLEAGQAYSIGLSGFSDLDKEFKWKGANLTAQSIPDSLLVKDHLTSNFKTAHDIFEKAATLVSAYDLTKEELVRYNEQSQGFKDVDFNSITLEGWKNVHDYEKLRSKLPKQDFDLLAFFDQTRAYFSTITSPPAAVDLKQISKYIKDLTTWDELVIESLLKREHLHSATEDSLQKISCLWTLHDAYQLQQKINAPVPSLFSWAKPKLNPTSNNMEDFGHFWKASTEIQSALRARFDLDDWEEIVKPLNDKLRTNQRNALIAYLLNQPALQDWGVTDANGLYEFFLIDVLMESCMETSRIKQAISAVQLFVQRIFLDLEPAIKNDEFDARRTRWEWMSRYRVWEANRKVFLYPENWLRSELRDTKTPFFKELESEMLQKDINPEMVKEALKSYLYKLDEVADMKVVGMYAKKDENGNLERLHVVSRTRNVPYVFYYRKYEGKNWFPWKKIQVDIPSYDYEADGEIISNGTYVMPIEWNRRLFIFFPEFLSKTKSNQNKPDKSFQDLSHETPRGQNPSKYWQIKMSFSEFKSGEWQQKKQSHLPFISTTVLEPKYQESDYWRAFINYHVATIQSWRTPEEVSELKKKHESIRQDLDTNVKIPVYYQPRIDQYNFRIQLIGGLIYIFISHSDNDIIDQHNAYYKFDGKQFRLNHFTAPVAHFKNLNFHYYVEKPGEDSPSEKIKIAAFNDSDIVYEDVQGILEKGRNVIFHHEFSRELHELSGQSSANTIFRYISSKRNDVAKLSIDFGQNSLNGQFNELLGTYSSYNWEIFYYTPILIAENLTKNQQFEEAMTWYHYIFHPYEKGTNAARSWTFIPFQDIDAKNQLEAFFSALKAKEENEAIREWRDNPFNPHLVARSRTVAYMKWVFMKYLDNLLEWGDYLFRQDTMESINYASQLYILASHLLGPKPQEIPKPGRVRPRSYLQIADRLDAFSNARAEVELLLPHSNQSTTTEVSLGSSTVYGNIFGLATTNYFCLPKNPKLLGYWDTVADRLYKIRHCLNIEGVFRKLSLFEPPIDPALLVAATAQGLSIASVLNELSAPIPNYRFQYMLQKAMEMCNEVKSLGNTLLSLKEKRDAEQLSLLRSRHELALFNKTIEIRKNQLKEAEASLDSLYENRLSPLYRMRYYLQQIGEDLSLIPDENADFSELADKIEQVVDESGLKLINLEKEELDKANQAANLQIAIGVVEAIAGILNVIPNADASAKPIGVGTGIVFGGQHLGAAASAVARALSTVANQLSFDSSNAARKAGFTRQLQERIMQANLAGREIKQIDKQITAQKIRIDIAQQELDSQQTQFDNAKEVEEYLKSKYTNEELYSWMDGQIKSLFFQSYKMAYDLAKKVEGLYRFDRGETDTNFIKFGYWNSARDGLLSGEQLYHSLKQIEIAYQEKRGHDYEITNKQISLRRLDPGALLNLRAHGQCEFAIPEELFVMDFPSHYKRRIKTVSFSIPCIAGPYTSISAKARLVEHRFRHSNLAYQSTDDDTYRTMSIPIDAIALSSAQNDGGVFELNFRDERYMPFEGAGAISRWKLELPNKYRQFDYHTISDVILHMSYTSCEGGEQLKETALTRLDSQIGSLEGFPQYVLFDLKHDFAEEWYKATLESSELSFDIHRSRLSYLTNGKKLALKNENVKLCLFKEGAKKFSEGTIKMEPLNPTPNADDSLLATLKVAYGEIDNVQEAIVIIKYGFFGQD